MPTLSDEPSTKLKSSSKLRAKKGIWTKKQPRVHYGSPRQRRKHKEQAQGKSKKPSGEVSTEPASSSASEIAGVSRPLVREKEKHHIPVAKPQSGDATSSKHAKAELPKTKRRSSIRNTSKQSVEKRPTRLSEALKARKHGDAAPATLAETSTDASLRKHRVQKSSVKTNKEASSKRNKHEHETREKRGHRAAVSDLETEHFAELRDALRDTAPKRRKLSHRYGNVSDSSSAENSPVKQPLKKPSHRSDKQSRPFVPNVAKENRRDAGTTTSHATAKATATAKSYGKQKETDTSSSSTTKRKATKSRPVESSNVESSIDSDLPRLAKLQCNSLKLIRNRKRRQDSQDEPLNAAQPHPPTQLSNDDSIVTSTRSRKAGDGETLRRTETANRIAAQPLRQMDTNRNRNVDVIGFAKAHDAITNTDNDRHDCRFELFPSNTVTRFGPRHATDARNGLEAKPTDAFAATRIFVCNQDDGRTLGTVGVMQIRAGCSRAQHPTRKPTIFSVIVADELSVVIDGRTSTVRSGDYFFAGSQTSIGFVNASNKEAVVSYSQFSTEGNCNVVPASASNVLDPKTHQIGPIATNSRAATAIPSASSNAFIRM